LSNQYTSVAVFDLDGTIADDLHRSHLLAKTPKDWDGYFDRCGEDEPVEWAIDLFLQLLSRGMGASIWTGRPERLRGKTEVWLYEHAKVRPNTYIMRMRPDGDYRHAAVLKHEWLRGMPLKPVLAVEDSPNVVEMFRSNGVPVLEVERRYDLQPRHSTWPRRAPDGAVDGSAA
jgi:hypothetical protein